MAKYPEEDSSPAMAIAATIFMQTFETPEQRKERIERDKVYELQRLNMTLERRQRFPELPESWISRPSRNSMYLLIIEVVVFLAIIALAIAAYLNGSPSICL